MVNGVVYDSDSEQVGNLAIVCLSSLRARCMVATQLALGLYSACVGSGQDWIGGIA